MVGILAMSDTRAPPIFIPDWFRRLLARWRKPPVVPPVPGVQAFRIADLMERFGVNTFSSIAADSNVWGSWPADYSQPSVIAALRWLTGASGLTMQVREYHYQGRDWQKDWCFAVADATRAKFTMAIGAGGGMDAAVSLCAVAVASEATSKWLARVEGINEPNNNFGSGAIPAIVTAGVQEALAAGVPPAVVLAGPSIVFGLPHPEGYITPSYASTAEMLRINSKSALANGHLYPPSQVDMDDGSGRGAMTDTAIGLRAVYANHPVILTEWHPTLYNSEGHKLDPAFDAYYAPCFFLAAFREQIEAWFWYSLLDYGTAYLSGLFPKTGGVDARPVARVIQAMFALTGDTGPNKRTFTPGKLAFTVSGLPPALPGAPNSGGQTMLFQNSLGVFFLFVWNAQREPGGAVQNVTVSFPVARSVTDYKISDPATPAQPLRSLTGAKIIIPLDASVHLLVIR